MSHGPKSTEIYTCKLQEKDINPAEMKGVKSHLELLHDSLRLVAPAAEPGQHQRQCPWYIVPGVCVANVEYLRQELSQLITSRKFQLIWYHISF